MKANISDDFHSLVINETPLLDVRAPIEFEKGAFTNATNIAILNDEERKLIGIKYKNEGNEAAVKLGEVLIGSIGQEERLVKWKEYIKENPNALLYCFRGGQRSGISQSWLHEEGIDITRLKGGYKAFRQYLMNQTLDISSTINTIIIGGRTGSGKTLLLPYLNNSIDLEGIANHRGSSFGNFTSSQPNQINFENILAYKLIQFKEKGYKNLVIEHESHNIGRAFIPKPVYVNFMKGQLVLLHTPMQERVDITYDEYVVSALESYTSLYQDDAILEWSKSVYSSLDKIQKRLGSKLHGEFKSLFSEALLEHETENGTILYKKWIESLLVNYYDPMYDYQIQKSEIKIIFEGNSKEVIEFINVLES